jgi:protein SCO1
MSNSVQPKQTFSPLTLVLAAFSMIALVAVIVIVLTGRSNVETDLPAIVEGGTEYTGITEVQPAEPIEDFKLTSTTGEPVNFSDYRGKWVLLYFGFTFCPDFCPTTLLDFKQVKEALGDNAHQVEFMMISVDGERDTPEALSTYLGRYDETFVGLTGTPEDVQPAADEFGVHFEKRENPDSEFYTVDHTISVFLVNPEGEWTTLYQHGTDPVMMAEDIQSKL